MARPQKVGLDYFPLDVDIDQDDKVAIIEAQHGIKGFGIVIKLLMHIYRNSYYYEWTEKEQLLFSKRVNVDINQVNDVVNDCIKWGLFDKQLFQKYKILTSRGVQKRYFEIAKRRQKVEVIKEYFLLSENDINVYNYLVFVNINSDSSNENTDINPQSKEKKSKEKESKEKEDISLQIKNLRSRYSEEQLKVIDEYFDILRWTRKNGKIADSVILKIFKEWEKFPTTTVIYALNVYIKNPKYHDKRENYCYGIMRNATAEEIAKGGMNNGKPKRDNGQDVDPYAGIGLTLEDLQQL